jgi:hypothetical protein
VVPAQDSSGGGSTYLLSVGLSFGAGFYEELFFRLLLVWALQWAFRLLGQNPGMIQNRLIIIFVTATLFSLAHFKFIVGSLGDDWNLYVFLFRMLFGGLMSVLLLIRGFGITAWTHALYDVLVYTLRAFAA